MRFKVKSDLDNFQRCQKFLQLFNRQKGVINHQQIHKLVGRFDRASIRNVANFKPLQQAMKLLTPQLINDKFVCSNAHMLSNLVSMFSNLNLYKRELMDHSSKCMLDILKHSKDINIEQMNNVYRAFIDLNEHSHSQFLAILKQTIKDNIVRQFQNIVKTKKYEDHQHLLKRLQIFHKYIRTFLLDPNLTPQFLSQIFGQLQLTFKALGKTQLMTRPHFLYNNLAVAFQYIKVLKIPIEQGLYYTFIKEIYEKRRKANQCSTGFNSQGEQQRKGESVFQNRFHKNLYLSGYWFQSNIKIGLNQYDVLVKGTRRQEFIPFQNVSLRELKQGKFTPISQQQRKVFESMKGLWFIDQKKQLKQDLIINLNGPYHYIEGDKEGLVRTQAFKQQILKYYGYSHFKSIDYRVWEKQTFNQRTIKNYLQKLIVF